MKQVSSTDPYEDKPLSDEQVAELMADGIPPEYDIDYSKAKPNRFAKREAAQDAQDKSTE